MGDHEREDTQALWNRVADDWRMQVGDDGDGNRILSQFGGLQVAEEAQTYITQEYR